MYKLKLFSGWEQKALEKIQVKIDGKWKTCSKLSKSQVKEIDKIIGQSEVIENNDEYIVYKLKEA